MNALDTDVIIDPPSRAPRRSRGRRLAIGAATVAVAGIAGGVMLIAPHDARTPRIVGTTVEDSPPPSAPIRVTLTDTSQLELNRIGPIVVGMTLDEASAAHGKPVAIDPGTLMGPGQGGERKDRAD